MMSVCASINLSTNGKGATQKADPNTESSSGKHEKKAETKAVDRQQLTATFLDVGETFEVVGDRTVDHSLTDAPVCGNGFLSTVHKAFADELPIALAPSHIWTLILQAVSIHVNENAESLRDVFVNHDGQKTLIVLMDRLRGSGGNSADLWSEAFPLFVNKLSENVKDKTLVSTMTNPYASGSQVEAICFTVAMMDSLKKYFKYRVRTMCGITAVHLLGKKSEWSALRDRACQLCNKLSLDWWSVELLPVLDQFVLLASGDDSNATFWQHMYRDIDVQGSGGEYCGFGWINVFFPYKASGGDSFERRCLDHKGQPYFETDKTLAKMTVNLSSDEFYRHPRRSHGFLSTGGIAYPDYPSGVNKCPFVWELTMETVSHDMRFCAGFLSCIGTDVLPALGRVCTPVQGWAVVYHQKSIDDPEATYNRSKKRQMAEGQGVARPNKKLRK